MATDESPRDAAEIQSSIIFTNCAGGARKVSPQPLELGKELRRWVAAWGSDLAAVGVSEAVLSHLGGADAPALAKAGAMCQPVDIPPYAAPGAQTNAFLQDHNLVRRGLGGPWYGYYLSTTNSADNCHDDAVARKWRGTEAAPRFQAQFAQHGEGLVIHHGVAILLRDPPAGARSVAGVLLRPAGETPEDNPNNDPMQFMGDRDTEPRTMVVAHARILGTDVAIAFCQLETHTTEDKRWRPGEDHTVGVCHRQQQVANICRYFENVPPRNSPVVLMGDFNARPETPELDKLKDAGFRQVMPDGWPRGVPMVYDKSEKEQGRPYTHLKHGILIDHAFVKGFDDTCYFKLETVQLAGENTNARVTDHRPIALTITRTP